MQYLVKILTNNAELELVEDFLNFKGYIFSIELFPGEHKDTLFNVYSGDVETNNSEFSAIVEFVVENGKQELLDVSKDILQDKDWQEAWKIHFVPIVAGRLVVGISEEEIKDFDKIKVVIDPGMAFGNGSHPTTKGCLIQIDKYFKAKMRVLDFGAGSGVLAIACDKLGASYVDAMDNDEVAVEACKRNVSRNNSNVNSYLSGDFVIKDDYEFVIANITVDVIIQFFNYFTEGQKKLKYVLLSGISDFRKAQMDLFLHTEGIVPDDIYEDDGWYTYLLTYNKEK